ncbi:DUF2637 domain-containing protein [Nocardia flavorosea]|uniref:DUF2637 domain-containing protein n=1 Tax=Nocardia flavorosea TaxID=53429 RepID=A0A846YE85_9NOCA|nr:DUF2637 domain-containing protein [Nocardia flavorosea]NKY56161.1 DUF2637 domain-containing protein [Nocardia flavorosea]
MRLARWSAALIILGVGAAAFRLSFSTLEDLARLARMPADDAWLFPLIVDGTILLATFGLLVCSQHKSERNFFLGVLVVGSLVSVAGNSVHAVAAGHPLPGWAAALVAAVAPISLLVDTHGLALLFRVGARQRAQAQAVPGLVPVTEPEPALPSALTEPAPEPLLAPVPEPESEPVSVPLAPVPDPAPTVPAPVPSSPSRPSRPVQAMLPIAVPVGGV